MEIKTSIKIFLIPAILFAVFFAFGNEAKAAMNYYVATNGNDSNPGTESQPWATFARAQDTSKSTYLHPGDTLMIKDGTYNQSLNVTVSGTQTNPITIKAENDGMAVIDGSSSVRPCYIANRSYINLEGVKCTNSSDNVVFVSGSDHINIRRVSGSVAGLGNHAVFQISQHSETGVKSTYVLVEDSVAYGRGRKLFHIASSNNNTLRRNFGLFSETSDIGNPVMNCFEIYPGVDNILENNICVKDPSGSGNPLGFGVSRNPWSSNADRNKFYGNIAYDINENAFRAFSSNHKSQNDEVRDFVSINCRYGFDNRGTTNLQVNQVSIIDTYATDLGALSVTDPTKGDTYDAGSNGIFPVDSDYEISGVFENSVIMNSASRGFYKGNTKWIKTVTSDYNAYWNITGDTYAGIIGGAHDNDETIKPNYDTATYGRGAYLIRPSNLKGLGETSSDIGAEVLYRYQDGALTGTPLWPWLMEDRIKNETGISVTWESGGGLWKTLDGVYSSQSDTTPPAAPTGLTIN